MNYIFSYILYIWKRKRNHYLYVIIYIIYIYIYMLYCWLVVLLHDIDLSAWSKSTSLPNSSSRGPQIWGQNKIWWFEYPGMSLSLLGRERAFEMVKAPRPLHEQAQSAEMVPFEIARKACPASEPPHARGLKIWEILVVSNHVQFSILHVLLGTSAPTWNYMKHQATRWLHRHHHHEPPVQPESCNARKSGQIQQVEEALGSLALAGTLPGTQAKTWGPTPASPGSVILGNEDHESEESAQQQFLRNLLISPMAMLRFLSL